MSLNTASSESYAMMMQTAARNFDRVVENVRAAARIKREMGARCRIRLQFLLYKENFRQIPFVGVYAETGACPVRSYYWNDDVAFRQDFHRMVEGLEAPGGEPFATLPRGGSLALPSHPAAGSPAGTGP